MTVTLSWNNQASILSWAFEYWLDPTGVLANAPAPAAFTDAAALAAVVASADGLAAVISSTGTLAADDCRNLNAVISGMDTSFIGPQRSAVVGPVNMAYRRFGPLRSSEKLQKSLVRPHFFYHSS